MLQLLFQELHLLLKMSCLKSILLLIFQKSSVLVSPSDFSPPLFLPALLDNLDGTLIHHTILRMDGAAGPS